MNSAHTPDERTHMLRFETSAGNFTYSGSVSECWDAFGADHPNATVYCTVDLAPQTPLLVFG